MTSKEFWKEELGWFIPSVIGGTIGAFALLGLCTWMGWC